ncbi:MAG: cytochrome c peroxidase [Pseudomonadota bacterium]|nr:cytochrome c peroxidase [Pseudomonadota bacterium]
MGGAASTVRNSAKLIFIAALVLTLNNAAAKPITTFTEDERTLILSHGPWPVKTYPDPSNRVSGNPVAIAFGEALFVSSELSIDRKRSCATCHLPERAHSDGKPISVGRQLGKRNTMPLFNLRLNTWYGWDGKSDSLWAHSITPLLDPLELGMTSQGVQRRISETRALANSYRETFGHNVTVPDAETAMVNIAKALAAYQETIRSEKSEFDKFREALLERDPVGIAAYSASAQRGAKLFVGRARCDLCHFGPNFTSGEFDNINLPRPSQHDRVDDGRYGGILVLQRSRYNLLSSFNDDTELTTAGFTRHLKLTESSRGRFRIPSLRNVSKTAPYMHDGSMATLDQVVRHYSKIPENRFPQTDEKLLRPLMLTDEEISDLVMFLKTL